MAVLVAVVSVLADLSKAIYKVTRWCLGGNGGCPRSWAHWGAVPSQNPPFGKSVLYSTKGTLHMGNGGKKTIWRSIWRSVKVILGLDYHVEQNMDSLHEVVSFEVFFLIYIFFSCYTVYTELCGQLQMHVSYNCLPQTTTPKVHPSTPQ